MRSLSRERSVGQTPTVEMTVTLSREFTATFSYFRLSVISSQSLNIVHTHHQIFHIYLLKLTRNYY